MSLWIEFNKKGIIYSWKLGEAVQQVYSFSFSSLSFIMANWDSMWSFAFSSMTTSSSTEGKPWHAGVQQWRM